MMQCRYCSRPANKKLTERDEWGRVRDIYICDKCDAVPRAFLDGQPLQLPERSD